MSYVARDDRPADKADTRDERNLTAGLLRSFR